MRHATVMQSKMRKVPQAAEIVKIQSCKENVTKENVMPRSKI